MPSVITILNPAKSRGKKSLPPPKEIQVTLGKIHPRPKLPEPTVAQMAENFVEATSEWAKAGFRLTEKEVALERRATCEACPGGYWDAKARRIPLTEIYLGKCNHPACGCTKYKVFLATSKCPGGYWKR